MQRPNSFNRKKKRRKREIMSGGGATFTKFASVLEKKRKRVMMKFRI